MITSLSFQLHDSVLVIVAGCGSLIYAIVYLSASQSHVNEMYIALVGSMLRTSLTVAARATVSKLVDSSETGAIFSLFAFAQAFNFLISPLINLIYVETLEWHEGFVYCIQCIMSIGVIILGCLIFGYNVAIGNWRQTGREEEIWVSK